MLKFKDAKAYIDSIKRISIHSNIKERKEFQSYLDDESPDNHFQMLWMMITDMVANPSNVVAECKKIYEFTLFAQKYNNIDLLSYITEDKILSIYHTIKKDEKAKMFAYNALVQFLLPQKNLIAFSILKKILTTLANEIKNEPKSIKNNLVSLADLYTKLEYMKLSIHKPQEITNYIIYIFQFLDHYQADRINSHLAGLPIYFYYKIIKFVSKILIKNPESNPNSLINLISFQPIMLISYKLPNQIDTKNAHKIFSGLTPLSIYQTYMPSEFPQFLMLYYHEIFFTIFEFFVIFACKPMPTNDQHDLQIITNTFNYVSRYESGKDAFLLCIAFFKKSKIHVYLLFRLYQYLSKKESSMVHDYCVMIFTIAFDCHFLPHTRTLMKSNHKLYFIQVFSAIEKNYQNSPFIQKVSFLKKVLIGEFYIPRDISIIQKLRFALSFNNYDQKRESIIKILQESTKYLYNTEVYIHFCLLIINSIQNISLNIFSDRFLIHLAFLVYSHDFFDIPRYHYLQVLKYYAINKISNSINSFTSLETIAGFRNPSTFIGSSIVFSRFYPLKLPNFQQNLNRYQKISLQIISRIILFELPQFWILSNEIIASSVRYYKLPFDAILSYLIKWNFDTSASSTIFGSRCIMRLMVAVTTIDEFDKFITNYLDTRKLLEIFVEIGRKNKETIPATPSFITIWKTMGSKQKKNEDLIASLILLSYNVNKTEFFFESLYSVVINMSNLLMMHLRLDSWEQSPIFIIFIRSLPMNLKIFPNLQKYKEETDKADDSIIESFKTNACRQIPTSTLATGITGCYYINNSTLID